MKLFRIVVLTAAAALGLAALGSCNTSRGLGQDLQMLGEGVTRKADQNAPAGGY